MDDLDKKIIIASAGNKISENRSNYEQERLYKLSKDHPNSGINAGPFKELFLGHLDGISQQANQLRNQVNRHAQPGYSWELKATDRLFHEASFLIGKISDQCTVAEFQDEVREQFRIKGLNWWYSSNWGNSTYHFVMRKLAIELKRFISDLPEIYNNKCICIFPGGS